MKTLQRRLDALAGAGNYYTIGEMLDHLDGHPLPLGKSLHPGYLAWLDSLKGNLDERA